MDPRQRNANFSYKVRRKLDYGTDPSAPAALDKEFKRRLLDEIPAVQAPQQVVTATPSAPIAAPAAKPIVPAPPVVIDRHHKESISEYGGYIYLDRDHDPSEKDQMPPTNAGYRSIAATASSLNDAYAKAVASLPLLKHPEARICIKITGLWYEHLVVTNPRIDFEGAGMATIAGQIAVMPFPVAPGQVATQFTNLNFISLSQGEGSGPNPTGALFLMPNGDINPPFASIRFRDCTFTSDAVAMLAQQRFYAENCHWFSTDPGPKADPANAPLQIILSGLELGATLLKDCSLHSFLRLPTTDDAGPTDYVPGGFALNAVGVGGPRQVISASTSFQMASPISRVVLNDCEVYGCIMVRACEVKHRGGEQHVTQAINSTIPTDAYATLMGTPLFDPANGYYGDNVAIVTFAQTSTYSRVIANAVPYNGTYPPGVTPATYPGECYVSYSQSSHYVRRVGGSPFVSTGGFGRADITNSSTGAPTWTGMITVNTFGSCPFNVPALQYDSYLI